MSLSKYFLRPCLFQAQRSNGHPALVQNVVQEMKNVLQTLQKVTVSTSQRSKGQQKLCKQQFRPLALSVFDKIGNQWGGAWSHSRQIQYIQKVLCSTSKQTINAYENEILF